MLIFLHFSQTGTSNTTYLADAGTVQLELLTLSRHTGNPVFAEKVRPKNLVLFEHKAKKLKHSKMVGTSNYSIF